MRQTLLIKFIGGSAYVYTVVIFKNLCVPLKNWHIYFGISQPFIEKKEKKKERKNTRNLIFYRVTAYFEGLFYEIFLHIFLRS